MQGNDPEIEEEPCAYLDVLNLSEYADAFYDAGADTMDLLEGMTVDELMEDFNMKKDEAEKLKKYVDRGGGGAIDAANPTAVCVV